MTSRPRKPVPFRSDSAHCRSLKGTEMLTYAGTPPVELLQHAKACLAEASQLPPAWQFSLPQTTDPYATEATSLSTVAGRSARAMVT